jgi:hypothetical protein
MKACKDCGQRKSLSEFYRHSKTSDGYFSSCKSCRKSYAKQHRIDDPNVRVLECERNRKPKRKAQLRANAKRWKKEHPDGFRAHNAANNALHSGKIIRRSSCEVCGSTRGRIHKHHADYSRPLDIVWLCARCHALETVKSSTRERTWL